MRWINPRASRSAAPVSRRRQVTAPTLLIVGDNDEPVLGWNRDAAERMGGPVRVTVIPGATHLFEEPGAMERVTALATDWFAERL